MLKPFHLSLKEFRDAMMHTSVVDGCVPIGADPFDRALLDRYKCPSDVATVSSRGPLSEAYGYFRFYDAVCFGRCVGASPAETIVGLPDVTDAVTCHTGRVALPFDLSEVVANLQQERYCGMSANGLHGLTSSTLSRRMYYLVRPRLPVGVRKHLQKIRLSGWEDIAFPRWPVDFTVDLLLERVLALTLKNRGLSKVPFIWFWPDGANACAIVTHDVEGAGGGEFCTGLMDLDDSYGLKAAFQVIPETPRYNSKCLVEKIRQRGFEVNVHDLNHDGHLFESRREFLRRIDRVNRYGREFGSKGFRSGAMYRDQSWYDRLEFSYDMSVPNVAHLEPQRGGCCTVMPYFVGNVLELPLTTVQDYSLFNILDDFSIALWQKQIDLILDHHGLITILTHPDYLTGERELGVYRELLEHLCTVAARRNVWTALPSEVDRWWRDRRAMSLVADNHQWRVEGPGSERARVAYAMLDRDRVVYQLA